MAELKKPRVAWLDTAKGLGIVLVVIGHLVAKAPPHDQSWWIVVKKLIYAFHMPFFMVVSGFTCFAFTKPFQGLSMFGKYAWSKFDRLMIPFLIFGLGIFLAKYAASRLVHVDNPVDGNSRPWDILVDPMSSYSAYLWYVYVLFLFSLVVPFLVDRGKWLLVATAGLSFVAYVGMLAGVFELKAIFRTLLVNAPYFFIGGALAYRPPAQGFRRWGWLFGVPFVVLAYFAIQQAAFWQVNVALQVVGAAGTLWAACCLAETRDGTISTHLSWIGGFAFPIYLMNTAAIGVTKAVMLKILPWDGWRFFLFLPIMLVAGLYGPIFVQQRIIERTPGLRRLLRR